MCAEHGGIDNLLALLEEHENALRELYELLAAEIPGHKALWLELAAEEAHHAGWVRGLRNEAEAGEVRVGNPSFLASSAQRSVDRVRGYILDIHDHGICMGRALAVALEVENSAVEKRYFTALEADSAQSKRLLAALTGTYAEHSRELREAARQRSKFSFLVDRHFISDEQLASAQAVAREEGRSVESVLVTQFNVPHRAMVESFGEFYGVKTYEFDPDIALPQELVDSIQGRYDELRSMHFVPVGKTGDGLAVALVDPQDVVLRDHVARLFGEYRVEYLVSTHYDVGAAVDHLFGAAEERDEKAVEEIVAQLEKEAVGIAAEVGEPEEAVRETDSAVVRLVNRMIEDAYARRASDIHIEPSPDADMVVRYRIDGEMRKAMTLPRHYRNAVVSRTKIMAELDIAERRKPQSGKIRMKRWSRLDIELRVETYPAAGGVEDAVLRILAASTPRALDDLAMSDHNLSRFKELIEEPYGLLLCVGPTGSGKTTTLHSALGHINREGIKILTVEDPVEITQRGLRQVQVNPKAGLTFASAMRSFLRADPDVIMIGEMRDRETASTAIEASLTGHLVLSTLHTNSAPETLVRLVDMGIDEYSFADSLLGVLAQRLVRTLCEDCRKAVTLNESDIERLREEYADSRLFDALGVATGHTVHVAREGGCGKCGSTGYRGRMGIHELLVATNEIKELIYRRSKASEIAGTAASQGMIALKQDGIEKALAGYTTVEAVRAVCRS